MICMIFQYGREPVQIQLIFYSFEAILEKIRIIPEILNSLGRQSRFFLFFFPIQDCQSQDSAILDCKG